MMTYSSLLHPWCIIRKLPDTKQLVVARFRRKSDAVAHLQVLQLLVKNIPFEIIFDVQTNSNLPQKKASNS